MGADQPGPSVAEKDLVEMLQKRLSVTVRRRTRLLDITISHEDAELARALADAFVEEYLRELAEVDEGTQNRRSQGLLTQAEEARQGNHGIVVPRGLVVMDALSEWITRVIVIPRLLRVAEH